MKEFTVKLERRIMLTDDMMELHFSKPADLSFEAGQFVQFKIPKEDRFALRSYSIASVQSDKTLEFCVKYLEEGLASNYFKGMEVGAEVVIRGALGRFVINDDAPKHYFIATGAGLAPIMGMIRDELESKNSRKEHKLLFGVRYEHDIFWKDRLDELQTAYPNFRYDLTLSRAPESWQGLAGRVTLHVNDFSKEDHFYICGSGSMVKDVRTQLINAEIDLKQIHLEIF